VGALKIVTRKYWFDYPALSLMPIFVIFGNLKGMLIQMEVILNWIFIQIKITSISGTFE
jgi:hypothetical protein